MPGEVIIMRGIPGAGKSTLALELQSRNPSQTIVVSADHYHMKEGRYCWTPEYAPTAHHRCIRKYLYLLQHSEGRRPTIIVDNTNIEVERFGCYYTLAEAYGFRPSIKTLEADPYKAQNVHDVPSTSVLRMHKLLMETKIPLGWNHEFIPCRRG